MATTIARLKPALPWLGQFEGHLGRWLARWWPAAATRRIASLAFVLVRIADKTQHVADIGLALSCTVPPGKLRVWRQCIVLVQIPHLLRVGQSTRTGHEVLEKVVQVVDIAN